MKFNIYNRFILDVVRENDQWHMFHLDSGKRIEVTDFAMPSSLNESEIAQYLDDIYHEASQPGDVIMRID